MTPLIITLLYLSKAAWYVVRNAQKLTNDIKLMTMAKIGPCVDWLKNKFCLSNGHHRYASFRGGVKIPYTKALARETLRTQNR